MSRAKLFNMVKSRGEQSVGRNPFDLSNRHVYTSKVGKITPVKALHTYPDDYFEVELSEFSQNNIPMNTAAFLSGKKELLAYFVPYNTVWHNYNQYQATREDPESTLLKEKGISFEPRMSLSRLYFAALQFCIGSWLFKSYIDVEVLRILINGADDVTHQGRMSDIEVGDKASDILTHAKNTYISDSVTYYDLAYSLALEHLKTLKFSDACSLTTNNSYLGVIFDCYENAVLHDNTLTYFHAVTNIQGNFIWCDWCQKLDMLGYSNLYPYLHELLIDLDSKLAELLSIATYEIDGSKRKLSFSYGVPVPSDYDLLSQQFDVFGDVYTPIFADIVQEYKTVLLNFSTVSIDGVVSPEYVNVYSIYAYNKCFYDYMRNTYYDTDYSVYNYNCDFIDGNTLAGSVIDFGYLPLRWYHIETHQWKKDMFTGVLPDNQLGQVSELILNIDSQPANFVVNRNTSQPIYGDDVSSTIVASEDGSSSSYPAFLSSVNGGNSVLTVGDDSSADGRDAIVRTPHTHGMSFAAYGTVPPHTTALNVLALKRAEAIQQYRQDLMRAGNRTNDIFKQVYGSSPKSSMDETPYFIDVASQDINVNPIVATAETGTELNGRLGDIAARSTIGGSSLNFKFSTKDFGVILFLSYIIPDSFYNSYRLDPMNTHLDQESHGLPYFQNLGLQPVLGSALNNLVGRSLRQRTLGFAPPYIEFKTDIDLVHGNLVDLYMPHSQSDVDIDYQGSMSHWVVARTDMQSEKTVTLRQFYINPRIVDNVFSFDAGDDYETDHYLTYASIKINSVRAFSELGLPRF